MMPLEHLKLHLLLYYEAQEALLKSLPLKTIGDRPAVEFWKELGVADEATATDDSRKSPAVAAQP